MAEWYEPITLALHAARGGVFRYLQPTAWALEEAFECGTCSGEGELQYSKPVGRIDEESWMDGCPDCEDGKREFVSCSDCGAALLPDDVAVVVRHEPRVYYYALCKADADAEMAEAKEEVKP